MSVSVCLFVCCLSASMSPELHIRSSPNYVLLVTVAHMAALRYVMFFRFMYYDMSAHNGPYGDNGGMSIDTIIAE